MVTVEMVDCRRVVEVGVTGRHVVSYPQRGWVRRTLVVVVSCQRRRLVAIRLVVPVVVHK